MKDLEKLHSIEYDTYLFGAGIEQPEFTKIAEPLQAIAEGGEQLRTDVTEKPIESAYALGKGAIAGYTGLAGDLISMVDLPKNIAKLTTAIYSFMGTPEGKQQIKSFVDSWNDKTVAPTTEDVELFLNQIIPKPSTEAAEITGELLSPGGYVKAGKSLAKASKKALTKAPKETRVKYDASGKRVTQ